MKGLAISILLSSLVASAAWAEIPREAGAGGAPGGGGASMPPITAMPGQGPTGRGPIGSGVGNVVGPLAKDRAQDTSGQKCRSQRGKNGSAPEC